MLNLFEPIWSKIVKWGGVIFGVILILLKVRQSGKDQERVDNLKTTLKGMQTRDKIINTVSNYTDAEYDRLLNKYTRK